ncbi:hypothetical protein RAM_22680 [Amycolatopsis mediterranei S699]|uniref:Uncharacterized protein n=1 Tax=Amycolatopsis mediterranei (strain S699) TaxID=713604 RepID=A0A9R0U9T6_AMYMS|nr:hypothetical protein RAM_22680 [Amycolatopsis mediterranei S699]
MPAVARTLTYTLLLLGKGMVAEVVVAVPAVVTGPPEVVAVKSSNPGGSGVG